MKKRRPTRYISSNRNPVERVWDFALSYDIGLAKLRAAVNVVICLACGMGCGALLSLWLGLPLQEGLTFGGAPGFQLGFAISDRTWQKELRRGLINLIPMSLSIALAISLHAFRPLELVLFVGVLAFMLYAGRISLIWADVSMGIYATFILGLLMPVPISQLPVIILLTVAGGLGAVVGRLALSRPNGRAALHFARLGYCVQVRNVFRATRSRMAAGSAWPKAQTAGDRALSRALGRLRAAALQAEGLIAVEGSPVGRDMGTQLSRLIFDTELGAELVGRCAAGVGDFRPALRGRVIAVMEGLDLYDFRGRSGPDQQVLADLAALPVFADQQAASSQELELLTYLIHQIAWLAELDEAWRCLAWQTADQDEVPFESAVEVLPSGRLPGTLSVVRQTEEHRKLSAQARTAIQAVIALAVMEPLGLLISDQRFYWGDIGVMVILSGTFTQRERIRKTWARLWGTVLGGLVGLGAAYLIQGNGCFSVALIILALAFGTYFVSTEYGLWVVGLVVALCQLYAATGALSTGLIALRLVENGLGATLACLVSSLVLPIRSCKVLRADLTTIFEDIGRFAQILATGQGHHALRAVVNRVELGIYQLETGSLYTSNIVRTDNVRDGLVQARLRDIALTIRLIIVQVEAYSAPAEDLSAYCQRVIVAAERLARRVCSRAWSMDRSRNYELPVTPQTRLAQLLVQLGDSLEEVERLLVRF